MESKHTPGPWRVGDAGHTVFGPKTDAPVPVRIADMGRTNFRANAALIAAAPDMYAALVTVEAMLPVMADALASAGMSREAAHALATVRAALRVLCKE